MDVRRYPRKGTYVFLLYNGRIVQRAINQSWKAIKHVGGECLVACLWDRLDDPPER